MNLFFFHKIKSKYGFWDSPGDTAPKRGDFVSGNDMYHRAKFRADRWHRRRDICPRTDTQNYSRFSIKQNAYRYWRLSIIILYIEKRSKTGKLPPKTLNFNRRQKIVHLCCLIPVTDNVCPSRRRVHSAPKSSHLTICC